MTYSSRYVIDVGYDTVDNGSGGGGAGGGGRDARTHRVRIGARAVCAGALTAIQPGAVLGERCTLSPLTLVPRQTALPGGTHWAGCPARKVADGDARERSRGS